VSCLFDAFLSTTSQRSLSNVLRIQLRLHWFIPDHALGFTGIGLPVENTLISLLRLHSLAFGFETLAFWQKAELSRRSTVFQGQPDTGSNEILGFMKSLRCKRSENENLAVVVKTLYNTKAPNNEVVQDGGSQEMFKCVLVQ
jgi:hypothetical protein